MITSFALEEMQMRKILVASSWKVVFLSFLPASVWGADNGPVGRKIDNAQIMDRVALVGVIASGVGSADDVAVIKDNMTGKTYAIKTGDNLPGVGHIKLKSVRREMAVFNADGKEFHVRLSIGGYTSEADESAADADDPDGSGLFANWHSGKMGGQSFPAGESSVIEATKYDLKLDRAKFRRESKNEGEQSRSDELQSDALLEHMKDSKLEIRSPVRDFVTGDDGH